MSDVKDLQPYAANTEGLTGVLEDLRATMPSSIVFKVVGYVVNAFENVTQGDVLYARSSDGQVGKAIANDTFDKAKVAGIAETTQSSGAEIRVLTRGIVTTAGLNTGDLYFLSASSAGAITDTPPTGSGNYLTRVGEAGSTGQFIIKIEPPILLS